jgi:hypothetical protein
MLEVLPPVLEVAAVEDQSPRPLFPVLSWIEAHRPSSFATLEAQHHQDAFGRLAFHVLAAAACHEPRSPDRRRALKGYSVPVAFVENSRKPECQTRIWHDNWPTSMSRFEALCDPFEV